MPKILGPAVDRPAANVSTDIKPTVFIGLGGTGSQVLTRLRGRFYERYNLPKGYPCMSFLWFDFDRHSPIKELDAIKDKIKFNEDEVHNIGVTRTDFEEYFNNPAQHRNVMSWIQPELAGINMPEEGAGQYRPLGRLGFFHHYHRIVSKLSAATKRIQTAQITSEMQDKYGVTNYDPTQLEYHVVCSIAGGTGAGTFLDMCFLLRHHPDFREGNIYLYLFLPPVFFSMTNNPEVYANAYAALKELEFYCNRRDKRDRNVSTESTSGESFHDFIVDWDGSGEQRIAGPPFNACYLIDNRTEGTGSISGDRKDDLFDMLAENLFMNFASSNFSTRKRSTFSNLNHALTKDFEYEYFDNDGKIKSNDIFSFRYSTLGYSKIYYPMDRIRQACAYRLIEDLVAEWTNDVKPQQSPEAIAEGALDELGISYDKLFERLAQYSNTETLGDNYLSWLGKQRNKHMRHARGRGVIVDELSRDVEAFIKEHFDRTPQDTRKHGHYVRKLRDDNRPAILKASEKNIRAYVRDRLAEPYTRLPMTQRIVNELHLKVLAVAERARTTLEESSRSDEGSAALHDTVDLYMEMLIDDESRKYRQRHALKAEVKYYFKALDDYLYALLFEELNLQIAELAELIAEWLGYTQIEETASGEEEVSHTGLQLELADLYDLLINIADDAKQNRDSFRRVQDHEIYVNLYDARMFERFYKFPKAGGTFVSFADLREQMENGAIDALQQLRDPEARKVTSIYDLLILVQDVDLLGVQEKLYSWAKKQFKPSLMFKPNDPIKDYNQINDGRESQAIEKFVDRSAPRLPFDHMMQNHRKMRSNYSVHAILGMNEDKRKMKTQWQQFEDRLKDIISSKEWAGRLQGVSTEDTELDSVYMYTEIAGVPLMAIEHLKEYRDRAYYPVLEGDSLRHMDKHEDRFSDILLMDQQQVEEWYEVFDHLLMGMILRIIKVQKKEDGRVAYSLISTKGAQTHAIPLKSRNIALNMLLRRRDFRQQVADRIGKTLTNFNDPQWENLYVLLKAMIDESVNAPFAPKYIEVGGLQIGERVPHEHRVLEERLIQVQQMLEGRGKTYDDLQVLYRNEYPNIEQFGEWVPIDSLGTIMLVFNEYEIPTDPA